MIFPIAVGLCAVLAGGCVRNTRGVRLIHLDTGEVQVIEVDGAPLYPQPAVRRFELGPGEVRVYQPAAARLLDQAGVESAELAVHTREHFTVAARYAIEHWQLLNLSEHEAVFDVRGHHRGFWWMGIPGEQFQWTVLARSNDGGTE